MFLVIAPGKLSSGQHDYFRGVLSCGNTETQPQEGLVVDQSLRCLEIGSQTAGERLCTDSIAH